jgi:hypothetical protein
MISRRNAILTGLGSAVTITTRALAGEFWNDKQPAEWSEKDVQRLLTRSPWAKEVAVQMNLSAMPGGGGPGLEAGGGGGGMGRGGGGMGGGPGGPGMGGGGAPMGGGPGEGGGMPQIKAVVRWESATPILAAMKKQSPEPDSDFYIISVSGLRAPGARLRAQPEEGTLGRGAERGQATDERLKQSTSLQPKGRLAISPARIENAPGAVAFFFAREGAPLSLDDKEVVFVTRMGPVEIKAKFIPKEMKFQGNLAV